MDKEYCEICRTMRKYVTPESHQNEFYKHFTYHLPAVTDKISRCKEICNKDICVKCRVCSLEHASTSQLSEATRKMNIEYHLKMDDLERNRKMDTKRYDDELMRRSNIIREKYEKDLESEELDETPQFSNPRIKDKQFNDDLMKKYAPTKTRTGN